jgi:hypothetical protein
LIRHTEHLMVRFFDYFVNCSFYRYKMQMYLIKTGLQNYKILIY